MSEEATAEISQKQKTMLNKYPKLFKYWHENNRQEPIAWNGLEIPDRWYDTVDKLCECVETFFNQNEPMVICTQLKSKFNQLRFYYDWNAVEDEYLDKYRARLGGMEAMAELEIAKIEKALEAAMHKDSLVDKLADV